MVSQRLRLLKERNNVKNCELSQMTGIPESTLSRIMTGQTSPTYENVEIIVKALGGTMNDICDIPVPPQVQMPDSTGAIDRVCDRLTALERELRQIQILVAAKDKWIPRMFIYACILTAVFIAWLVLDVCLPQRGFIIR